MRTDAAPSTALERARIAYEEMQRREHIAAMRQRARARARNIALAAMVGTMLVLVIGLSLYNGWMPTPLRATTNDMRADKGSKFGEARTTQVRSYVKGNTCQELKFSNDSGALIGGSLVPCEAEPKREPLAESSLPPPPAPKAPRLNSVRDAFGK